MIPFAIPENHAPNMNVTDRAAVHSQKRPGERRRPGCCVTTRPIRHCSAVVRPNMTVTYAATNAAPMNAAKRFLVRRIAEHGAGKV
jgi:hypothetical protein